MAPLTRIVSAGYGTVFRMSPDGSAFATLVYFDGCDDGAIRKPRSSRTRLATCMARPPPAAPARRPGHPLPAQHRLRAPNHRPPASQVVLGGANVLLSVAVSGARPFSYQWQRNGTNLVDGGNISGSTNREPDPCQRLFGRCRDLSVTVSNALGSATSSGARLTVVYPPVFLSAVQSNCTLTLTWSTVAGQQYRLQYKPSPESHNWTYLGGMLTATGTSPPPPITSAPTHSASIAWSCSRRRCRGSTRPGDSEAV